MIFGFFRNKKLENKVIKSIKRFEPFKQYNYENLYQIDLARHLKCEFPSTKIETQEGSSRPDIVVNNVAIEIKGRTRSEELKTIADKCMRYSQHFDKIIIVLFELYAHGRYYDEWKKGLKIHFPNVVLIKKD